MLGASDVGSATGPLPGLCCQTYPVSFNTDTNNEVLNQDIAPLLILTRVYSTYTMPNMVLFIGDKPPPAPVANRPFCHNPGFSYPIRVI